MIGAPEFVARPSQQLAETFQAAHRLAAGRVAEASSDARSTAADVKALADALAAEAESLEAEVRRFLTEVEAA